jgi:tetratricopeptide (TPR) repeat protein
MRPHRAIIWLAASMALAVLVAWLLGPIEGLSVGCAFLALWCGAALYLSTRNASQETVPLDVAAPARAHVSARAHELAPEHAEKPAGDTSDANPPQNEGTTATIPEPEQKDPASSEHGTDVAPAPMPPEDAEMPHQRTEAAAIVDVTDKGDEEPPASAPVPTAIASSPDPFDFEAFRRALLFSSDPIATLREIVDDIRERTKTDPAGVAPVEAFLERELTEAGLYDQGVESDHVRVVLPYRARMFYLRISKRSMTYESYLHLIRIESALNALLLAHELSDDLNALDVSDLYVLRQRATSSICAQAPGVDMADWSYLAMPWQVPYGPSERGEWAVREAMSMAIESVRLPYRLEARFRCNVMSGDVALEFMATPGRVFPRTACVPALGLVPTTRQMRDREASKYAARVGLLMTAHAFRASDRIRRVWISAVLETPRRHCCLYSVRIDRREFSHVRLDTVSDPLSVLRHLGANMHVVDESLQPTQPRFYLEDARFCPPHRHDLWQLSERSLPPDAARSLGCARVSGLVIHEQLVRDVTADAMLRSLQVGTGAHRTQSSIQSIMDAAHATSDMSVWSAAERVATKLVNGSIECDQFDAIREEFVEGDALSRAVKTSQQLLMTQRPEDALDVLRSALGPLEAEGRYVDSPTVAYRNFDSFTERVMYNRLNRNDKRSVVLVPDAYPVAHLTLSALYSSASTEDKSYLEAALSHAQRALDVAPLSSAANLGVAACLEALDKTKEAQDLLRSFLSTAYHNQSMGMAYFRLASLLWHDGDHLAGRACYYQAARTFPPLFPFIVTEYQTLAMQSGDNESYEMSEEQVEEALRQANIPLAPTQDMAYALYDGATASVDAEVFPVAHDLLTSLEALTGDDVIHGIRMSLENEPDA